MYKVGKIVDPDILHDMTEDCLSGTWQDLPATVYQRDPDNKKSEGVTEARTNRIFKANHRLYPDFCEQLEEWIGDGTKVTQLDLLIYKKGETFVKHLDPIDDHAHNQKRPRIWSTSTILHLSDDYVGDGLRIYSEQHSDDYVVPRQEVGDTVIFPSKDTWHEAAPVEQGTRMVAVAWLGFG